MFPMLTIPFLDAIHWTPITVIAAAGVILWVVLLVSVAWYFRHHTLVDGPIEQHKKGATRE